MFADAGVRLGLGERLGSACQKVLRSTAAHVIFSNIRGAGMVLAVANDNIFGIYYGFKAEFATHDDLKKVGAF
jgi:hypothetical protein